MQSNFKFIMYFDTFTTWGSQKAGTTIIPILQVNLKKRKKEKKKRKDFN